VSIVPTQYSSSTQTITSTQNSSSAQTISSTQSTSSELRNLWDIPYISPEDAHEPCTVSVPADDVASVHSDNSSATSTDLSLSNRLPSSVDDEAHSSQLVSSLVHNDRDPTYIPGFLNLLNVNSPYGRRSGPDLLPYGIDRDTIFLHSIRSWGPAPLPEEHGLFSYYMAKDFPSEMRSEYGSNLSRPFVSKFFTMVSLLASELHNCAKYITGISYRHLVQSITTPAESCQMQIPNES
jgi:hypothetical protein